MQLLSGTPQNAEELRRMSQELLAQCGFEVKAAEDRRLEVVDTTVEPEQRMVFLCVENCRLDEVKALEAMGQTVQVKGIICLQLPEGIEAVDIKILDWTGFNQYFQNSWLSRRLAALQEAAAPLVVFTDAFSDRYDDLYQQLSAEQQAEVADMIKTYGDLPLKCNLMMGIPFWLHYNAEELKKAVSYAAFISKLEKKVRSALTEFCEVYGIEEPRKA